MRNKIKALLSACIFILGVTAFLSAAGSYLETQYGTYDVQTPSQNDGEDNKLTIIKQVFSGSIPTPTDNNNASNSFLGDSNNHFIYTPTIYNGMSTDSGDPHVSYNVSKERYNGLWGGEQRYEMKKANKYNSERLLPGYPALPKDLTAKKTTTIFDIYPGNADIINNEDVKVSFKIYASKDTTGNYVSPYMDLNDFKVAISIIDNNGSTNNNAVEYFKIKNPGDPVMTLHSVDVDGNQTGSDSIRWITAVTGPHNDGLAYGFNFIYSKPTMDSGVAVRVDIDVKYAQSEVPEGHHYAL
jgi:hypothetical protein